MQKRMAFPMARRPGLDKRVLIDEAAALADARGLEFVTMSNIAARFNVRVQSIYNHIETADDLQRDLSLFALQALSDAISHAAIGKNGASGLLAIANAYRKFAREHPGLYSATRRAPRPDDEEMVAITSGMLEVLGVVLAPFNFEGDKLIHVMRGFRCIMHGFVSIEADKGFGLQQNTDESFQFILQLFISGLTAVND
jgi:AcrR family transcriptional regulator